MNKIYLQENNNCITANNRREEDKLKNNTICVLAGPLFTPLGILLHKKGKEQTPISLNTMAVIYIYAELLIKTVKILKVKKWIFPSNKSS